jgi:hypothetical protein
MTAPIDILGSKMHPLLASLSRFGASSPAHFSSEPDPAISQLLDKESVYSLLFTASTGVYVNV